jgi:hypothetical protein
MEMLKRTGTIQDFWINKIKNKCCVEFANIEQGWIAGKDSGNSYCLTNKYLPPHPLFTSCLLFKFVLTLGERKFFVRIFLFRKTMSPITREESYFSACDTEVDIYSSHTQFAFVFPF